VVGEHGSQLLAPAIALWPSLCCFGLAIAVTVAAYDWPGNVREFENAVEHALAVVDGPRIPVEALPEEVRSSGGRTAIAGLERPTYSEAVDLARDRASREYLIALMREFRGNVARASERAGVERESLHRLLKRHGLRSTEFKSGD
jgi:DNA-binding NtrC family response regulator